MTSGPLSRLLARVAAALWLPIAAIYTIFVVGYASAALRGAVTPTLPQAILQLLVYASISVPGWLMVWALWTRPSWRVAITSALIGVLLFALLAGTSFGILALAAGLLPLVALAVRPER